MVKRVRKEEFENDTERVARLQNIVVVSGIQAARDFISEQCGGNDEEIAEIESQIDELNDKLVELRRARSDWNGLLLRAMASAVNPDSEEAKLAVVSAAKAAQVGSKRLTKAEGREIQDKILDILKDNPGLGKPQIEGELNLLGIKGVNVSQMLSKMKKAGGIASEGGKRNMTYKPA